MPPEDDAPVVDDAPVDVDSEIADDQTFDAAYVRKLRAENAKRRTELREYEETFANYEPHHKERFLEMARMLDEEPDKALVEYETVTNNLREMLGLTPEEPPVADQDTPTTATDSLGDAPDEITDIASEVERRVKEAFETRDKEEEYKRHWSTAESLSDEYKTPAGKAFLFAIANEKGIELEEAHEVVQSMRQEAIDAAVEEAVAEIRAGKRHAPRISTGDPGNAQDEGPPKTLAEARKRTEARFNALQ